MKIWKIYIILTKRTGSPVLMRALGRANLDSKGVLGLISCTSSHSSRVSIRTVPCPSGAFWIFLSSRSCAFESSYWPRKRKRNKQMIVRLANYNQYSGNINSIFVFVQSTTVLVIPLAVSVTFWTILPIFIFMIQIEFSSLIFVLIWNWLNCLRSKEKWYKLKIRHINNKQVHR